MSEVEKVGFRRTSRAARTVFGTACLIVVMGMISSCSYFESDGDAIADATSDIRRKSCALELANINFARLVYASKAGGPATSLDQLVDAGYLLSVVGHRMAGDKVVETEFCVVKDVAAGAPGDPATEQPDLQDAAELVKLAKSIFMLAMLGPGGDAGAYDMNGKDSMCFASELSKSIGKFKMERLARNQVSPDKNELKAARDALNKCDPAEAVGVIVMDVAHKGLNSTTGGSVAPTPGSVQCVADSVRGRVGVFALQHAIDGVAGNKAEIVPIFTKCIPYETVVVAFEDMIAKGGASRSVTKCAARKAVDRFGASRFLGAAFDTADSSAARDLESVVFNAVRECM